ncbi:MAG: hypothetical protein NUV83_00955 [Candidatus Wolfebacteria bacterium]|nr:hypothetical protein [Candidatus Wolfebacteria bacterium]
MDKQIYYGLLSLIPISGIVLVTVTAILLIVKLRAVKGQTIIVLFIIGVALCELRPQELKNVTIFSELPDNRYQIAGQVPTVNYAIISYKGRNGIDVVMVKDVPGDLKLGTIFVIKNGQVEIEWQPEDQQEEQQKKEQKEETEEYRFGPYDFRIRAASKDKEAAFFA